MVPHCNFSLLFCCALVVGCSQSRDVKEIQAALKPVEACLTEMTSILESVKDESTAQDAAQKLDSALDRYKKAYDDYLAATRSAGAQVTSGRNRFAGTPLESSKANANFDQQLTRVLETVPSSSKHLAKFVKKHGEIRGTTNDDEPVDEPTKNQDAEMAEGP